MNTTIGNHLNSPKPRTWWFFVRLGCLLMVSLLSYGSTAQQTPVYSQYFINPYLFNPATVGQSDHTRMFFLYRNQWAGIEGSPETQVFTIDGRLKNQQVGLGFTFFNDVTNVIGRINGALTGAYRFKITEDQRVAFGMSAQIIQNRIYFDRIVAEDITDPNLLNEVNQQTSFDANFGFSYQWKKMELGFAVDQLFQNDVNFENASQFQSLEYTFIRHYITSLSYNHDINELFSVKPMVLARLVEGRAPQFDANVVFSYDDVLWLSGAYRHEIGIGGSVGFRFDDQFTIGYSYEFPNSDLSILGAGTHEFLFGIRLSGKQSTGSTSGSGANFKRRDIESIQEENKEQFEKISQLEQEKDQRENEIRQTESLVDRQQVEILKLKQTILQLQGDIDELKTRNQFLPEKEDLDNDAKYYLVVGAFRELENAKIFQKIIKREGALDTKVIQNNRQTWYLIYTEEVTDTNQISNKIEEVRNSSIADLLVGTPWVFKKNPN